MIMKRKPLHLLVDEDLVKKARSHDLNLSKFFENQLRGYFNFIEGSHKHYYNPANSRTPEVSKKENSVGPPRFELGLLPPQGRRMPSYPTGPFELCNYYFIQKLVV